LPRLGLKSRAHAVEGSDASTSLLLERFYALHLQQGVPIAEALRQSRLWLLGATAEELGLADRYREILSRPLPPKLRSTLYVLRRQAAQRPDTVPFADPYFWAPFVLHGAESRCPLL
jgi:CHAT domain-containing protein